MTKTELIKLEPPRDRLVEYQIPEFTGNTNGDLWNYKNDLIQLLKRHNNDKREIKLWLEKAN